MRPNFIKTIDSLFYYFSKEIYHSEILYERSEENV